MTGKPAWMKEYKKQLDKVRKTGADWLRKENDRLTSAITPTNPAPPEKE